MYDSIALDKNIPVLLKASIPPRILMALYRPLVIKGRRIRDCADRSRFSSLAREECLQPDAFARDIRRAAEVSKKYPAIKILAGGPPRRLSAAGFFAIPGRHFPSSTVLLSAQTGAIQFVQRRRMVKKEISEWI